MRKDPIRKALSDTEINEFFGSFSVRTTVAMVGVLFREDALRFARAIEHAALARPVDQGAAVPEPVAYAWEYWAAKGGFTACWKKKYGEPWWPNWESGATPAFTKIRNFRPLFESAAPQLPSVDQWAVQDDPIQALIRAHSELLEPNPYAYFELAYTRRTAWMAWLCDRPSQGEPGTPAFAASRKVIARGQGDTAEETCRDALAVLAAPQPSGETEKQRSDRIEDQRFYQAKEDARHGVIR